MRFLTGVWDFSLLQNHPDRLRRQTKLLLHWYRGSVRCIKRPKRYVDHHLVPRLRMTGAKTQLLLYYFTVLRETNLLFVFINRFQRNTLNTIGRKSRLYIEIIFIVFKELQILKVLPVVRVFRVGPGDCL